MILKTGLTLNRLHDCLKSVAADRTVADLRIGLSYVGLKLDNGAAGVAAVVPETTSRGCTVLKEAGTFAGACAADSLQYLVSGKNALHRAIGLATANALTGWPQQEAEDREATSYFNLKTGEKVAMVGLFAPLVERIRSTGAKLTIIEKNPERLSLISEKEKKQALQDCDVALMTATTLLNHTFEEMVGLVGSPRVFALIGPSTPLLKDIFQGTPVNHLGGAVVVDAGRVLQIISEGGGTPALRPYLRFVNIMMKKT